MRSTAGILGALALTASAVIATVPGAQADNGSAPPLDYDRSAPSTAHVTATYTSPATATIKTHERILRDSSDGAPLPDYDPTAPASVTVVATPTAAPNAKGAGAAATAGAIACTITYDYPHPATSTGRTTINAHLTARCDSPVDSIWLASQMCHANLDSCGTRDSKFRAATNYVQIGGDMPCGPLSRAYQAFGSVEITFGPEYTPSTYSDFLASQQRSFQKVGGICVAS